MRTLFIALALSSLPACTNATDPLSERECRSIADRQAFYMLAISGDNFDALDSVSKRDDFKDLSDMAFAQCTSLKVLNRADYQCVMAATLPSDAGMCIAAAYQRTTADTAAEGEH